MNTSSNIAILFFSRSADNEALAKNWTRNKSYLLNRKIANLLIKNTEKALLKSALPIYRFNETAQTGNSFGENIASAYEQLFEMGYSSVIAVGNDHANIQNINWNAIRATLTAGKSVVGASIRGGAYLIGLQKEAFSKAAFTQLPWQTNKLFNALCKYVKKDSQLTLLVPERDLNTFYDVIKYFKSAAQHTTLAKQLIHFFYEVNAEFTIFSSALINHFSSTYRSLRAPPLAG